MTLRARWILWTAFTVLWTIALVAPISENLPFSNDPYLQGNVRFVVAKTIHALAYASWTILTASLMPSFGVRLGLLFFLMAHAVGTEIGQTCLPRPRDGCLRDAAIDHAGILLGMILSWQWWTRPTPPSGPKS